MTSTPDVLGDERARTLAPFLVSVDLVAGRLSLHGELDRRQVDRLRESVAVLAYSSSAHWSVDVAGLTFCDAGGVRGLLAAQARARVAGRTLHVTRCGPWMRRLLQMAGCEELLQPVPDRTAELTHH